MVRYRFPIAFPPRFTPIPANSGTDEKKPAKAGFPCLTYSAGYTGYSTPEICCRIRSTWQL